MGPAESRISIRRLDLGRPLSAGAAASLVVALVSAAFAFPAAAQSRRETAPAAQTPPAPAARRLAAAPAKASGTTLKEVRDAFAKADTDQNHKLSAAEAQAAGWDSAAVTAADADSDQSIDADEYVVARAAKAASSAAADLTAESTRLQALRRVRQTEQERARREPTDAGKPASGGTATDSGAPTAPAGPAAARRARAAAEAPAPERSPEELRAAVLRRLRNAEITDEQAREMLEAIDKRVSIALSERKQAAGAGETTGAAGATPLPPLDAEASAAQQRELRALQETAARRLRGNPSDVGAPQLDPPSAAGTSGADAAGTAAGSEGFRAKLHDAQTDLTRRLRNQEDKPENVAASQQALARRMRNAIDADEARRGASDVATPPAAPARTERPATDAPAPARARPLAPTAGGTAPASGTAPESQPARRAPAAGEAARDGAPTVRPARTEPAPSGGAAPQPLPQPARPARPATPEAPAKPATPDVKPASGDAKPAQGGGRPGG